ncbi:M15 family metallopeptidase [Marivita sp. S6314]|uniref:M15 family metallopeptidase n=1 Tax=Marivita sp. S6314 TaxID=2926406 RepID=UPI001FF4A81A|nr:M15 family metallopeptidase [Marivita sp. S6314]MCK0149278.1 M15 family metallopeptidase [Marivita sp. S6314]
MRVLPAVIIGVAILLASVIWVFVPMLLQEEEFFEGPAIDSGARIEIEMLNQQIEDLRERVDTLTTEVTKLASRPVVADRQVFQAPAPDNNQPFQQDGPNDIIDAYAQVVLIADRRNVNDGLTIAGSRWLAATFGLPRESLDQTCREMTNQRLADKLRLQNVGPIRVRMLQPAIDSLTRVFEKVRATDPDLYDRISTAGSLCVRAIRGTTNRASTHSYGLAVDLNIDGKLDTLGDGKTQLGLTILADFFKEEGWVWGASWRREDSMHFEVSRQKLEEWVRDGKL